MLNDYNALRDDDEKNLYANIICFLHMNIFSIACLSGQRYNLMLEKCENCPKNTFQPREGELICVHCQTNTITKYSGSTRAADCVQCMYVCRSF